MIDFLHNIVKQIKFCVKDDAELIVSKLGFLISKIIMIFSNDLKVKLIDRKINVLKLVDFVGFYQHKHYLKLEKKIVEQFFEGFNIFQEHYMNLNEQLSVVIKD